MGSFSEGCTDDPETVLLWFEKRIIRSQPPYAMGSHQTPDWFQVHGILTPAGFSASSVEKYHYALHMSSPIGCFPGYRRINVVARFLSEGLGAFTASARDTGNVSDACIFSFEGAFKRPL